MNVGPLVLGVLVGCARLGGEACPCPNGAHGALYQDRCGCLPAAPGPPEQPAGAVERFVDPDVAPGGDGSAARPWQAPDWPARRRRRSRPRRRRVPLAGCARRPARALPPGPPWFEARGGRSANVALQTATVVHARGWDEPVFTATARKVRHPVKAKGIVEDTPGGPARRIAWQLQGRSDRARFGGSETDQGPAPVRRASQSSCMTGRRATPAP